MLTKGDVLAAMGTIKDARGSAGKLVMTTINAQAEEARQAMGGQAQQGKKEAAKPLTASEIRQAIMAGFERASAAAKSSSSSSSSSPLASGANADFDAIIGPYERLFKPAAAAPQPHVELPSVDLLVGQQRQGHQKQVSSTGGAAKDEWEGLF